MKDKMRATDREMDILRMIHGSIKKYGFPPTRAEIARYFDFNSKNSASDFVKNLAKREYLDLFVDTSRGLRITKKGHKELKERKPKCNNLI